MNICPKKRGAARQLQQGDCSIVNAEGFPCPVPMTKICTMRSNGMWMSTGADSVKTAEFRANGKAGLCYSIYDNSVPLRETAEITTDDTLRKKMWQDWFIEHFPEGPAAPNYVLLHFIGHEATIRINGEFRHENLIGE